jgi:hypothetical protein
MRKNR